MLDDENYKFKLNTLHLLSGFGSWVESINSACQEHKKRPFCVISELCQHSFKAMHAMKFYFKKYIKKQLYGVGAMQLPTSALKKGYSLLA